MILLSMKYREGLYSQEWRDRGSKVKEKQDFSKMKESGKEERTRREGGKNVYQSTQRGTCLNTEER